MYIWCKKDKNKKVPFMIHAGMDTVTFEVRGYDSNGNQNVTAHHILNRDEVRKIRDKLDMWLEDE